MVCCGYLKTIGAALDYRDVELMEGVRWGSSRGVGSGSEGLAMIGFERDTIHHSGGRFDSLETSRIRIGSNFNPPHIVARKDKMPLSIWYSTVQQRNPPPS